MKEETKRFNEEYDKNHDGKLDKDEASVTFVLLFMCLIMCKIKCVVQIDQNLISYCIRTGGNQLKRFHVDLIFFLNL